MRAVFVVSLCLLSGSVCALPRLLKREASDKITEENGAESPHKLARPSAGDVATNQNVTPVPEQETEPQAEEGKIPILRPGLLSPQKPPMMDLPPTKLDESEGLEEIPPTDVTEISPTMPSPNIASTDLGIDPKELKGISPIMPSKKPKAMKQKSPKMPLGRQGGMKGMPRMMPFGRQGGMKGMPPMMPLGWQGGMKGMPPMMPLGGQEGMKGMPPMMPLGGQGGMKGMPSMMPLGGQEGMKGMPAMGMMSAPQPSQGIAGQNMDLQSRPSPQQIMMMMQQRQMMMEMSRRHEVMQGRLRDLKLQQQERQRKLSGEEGEDQQEEGQGQNQSSVDDRNRREEMQRRLAMRMRLRMRMEQQMQMRAMMTAQRLYQQQQQQQQQLMPPNGQSSMPAVGAGPGPVMSPGREALSSFLGRIRDDRGVRPQSMLLQDSRLTPDQRMPTVPRDPGFGGPFNPIMQQDPRMHQQMMMMMMQDSRMQLSPRTNYPEMQKLPNVEAFRLHQAMMEGPKMPFVPANFRPDATMQSLNHFAAVPNPKFVNPFASILDPRTNHFAAMQGHSEQRGQTVPFSVMQDPRMQDLEPERDPRVQPFLPPNTGSGDSLVPSDPRDNRIYKEIEDLRAMFDSHRGPIVVPVPSIQHVMGLETRLEDIRQVLIRSFYTDLIKIQQLSHQFRNQMASKLRLLHQIETELTMPVRRAVASAGTTPRLDLPPQTDPPQTPPPGVGSLMMRAIGGLRLKKAGP